MEWIPLSLSSSYVYCSVHSWYLGIISKPFLHLIVSILFAMRMNSPLCLKMLSCLSRKMESSRLWWSMWITLCWRISRFLLIHSKMVWSLVFILMRFRTFLVLWEATRSIYEDSSTRSQRYWNILFEYYSLGDHLLINISIDQTMTFRLTIRDE